MVRYLMQRLNILAPNHSKCDRYERVKDLLKVFALKDFVGVVDASTLSDYVKTYWKDYKDRILEKTK